MARYFFHIVDGAIDLDDLGMELASPDDAKRAAVRYGANL